MSFTQTNIKKFASTANAASYTVTLGFTATANRLLVIVINADDLFSGNITDNLSATWSVATSATNNTAGKIAYKVAAGGETSVSFALVGSFPAQCTVMEYSGNVTASVLDIANFATGNSTTPKTATITTTNADDLLIACFGVDLTGTTWSGLSTGWTQDDNSVTSGGSPNDFMLTAHIEETATGSYFAQATVSTASPWIAMIASFKAAAAGGSPVEIDHLLMLGCT